MSQSQEDVRTNGRKNGRRDRQTIFYRTLPAKAGGPATSLHQATGRHTPNLVLKRMLRYFLKIPLLKKILQF